MTANAWQAVCAPLLCWSLARSGPSAPRSRHALPPLSLLYPISSLPYLPPYLFSTLDHALELGTYILGQGLGSKQTAPGCCHQETKVHLRIASRVNTQPPYTAPGRWPHETRLQLRKQQEASGSQVLVTHRRTPRSWVWVPCSGIRGDGEPVRMARAWDAKAFRNVMNPAMNLTSQDLAVLQTLLDPGTRF